LGSYIGALGKATVEIGLDKRPESDEDGGHNYDQYHRADDSEVKRQPVLYLHYLFPCFRI
jgi:hypothetical protein